MGIETAGTGLGPAMNILATGGAGYIGSTACLTLPQAGYQVTVPGWKATHDVGATCRDAWRWQEGNPLDHRE